VQEVFINTLSINERMYKSIREKQEGKEIEFHLRLRTFRDQLFPKNPTYELYNVKLNRMPKFKQGQHMKPYQVTGVNWLIKSWHENRNIVLADEMGLGKTIQSLALLDYLHNSNINHGPFLVIAPLTTLSHWKKVADEWTHLNAVLYYDSASGDGRSALRQYEWFSTEIKRDGRPTQKHGIFKFDVIITSFEVFCQDLWEVFLKVPFQFLIVDEAHRLKNKQAKTLSMLKMLPCIRILLLTGTPVQNNTQEIFTLMNYIEPYKFYNQDNFMQQFGNLRKASEVETLKKILAPYFLRRLKEDVEKSIPPRQETLVQVGLTKLQMAYYKGIYGENKYMLAKLANQKKPSLQLNNMDIQLRKCCNHLFLLKGVEDEICKDAVTDQEYYEKIIESSGKLILLDKFIDKFRKKEGSKILIFSQFKGMLDILSNYLTIKQVPIEILTGSVKSQDRIMAI
jgi:chromodomain-helicase-DNA-binding protein 7